METLTVMSPYLPDDERAQRLNALRLGEIELRWKMGWSFCFDIPSVKLFTSHCDLWYTLITGWSYCPTWFAQRHRRVTFFWFSRF
jgi:hypothetical protein